jgi:hypothetical protein
MPPKRKNESGKTGKEASSSKRQKSGGSTVLYLVRAEEYGEYRENEGHTIGIYSSKKLALENARIAFEEQFSRGFFQNGESVSLSISKSPKTTPRLSLAQKVTMSSTSNVIRREMDPRLPWRRLMLISHTSRSSYGESKQYCGKTRD